MSSEGNEDENEEVQASTVQMPETDFVKPLPKKRKVQDYFESKLIDILSQNQQPKEDDADKMFLLSLLPQFQSLSPDNKMLAQIEFIQTLRRLSKLPETAQQNTVINTEILSYTSTEQNPGSLESPGTFSESSRDSIYSYPM